MTIEPRIRTYVDRLLEEWKLHGKIIISVDYDDTLSHWKLGNEEDRLRTVRIVKESILTGAYVVIFSACNPDRHSEIKEYCREIDLPIDAINKNPIDLPYGGHPGSKIFYNINLCDRSGLTQALDILEAAMYRYRGYLQNQKPAIDVG